MDKKMYDENFGKTIAKHLDSEEGRKAIANKIVEFITNEVEVSDLSGLILDKESIQLGNQYEWIHRSKLKAYWHEPGSYAPRTSMTQRVFRIPTKMVSAHPEYEIGLLKAGRYGTIGDQVTAAKDAITGEVNAMAFNTLTGAITSSLPNYAAVALTAANATNVTNFKTALDRAVRWCKQRPGGAKAIIGAAEQMDFLADFSNSSNNVFSQQMVENFNNTGVINIYRGVPVVGLPQYLDANGKPTIPANYVTVTAPNVGKVVFEEQFQQMNDIDVNDLMWHMHVWTRVGAGVLFTENAFLIKLG